MIGLALGLGLNTAATSQAPTTPSTAGQPTGLLLALTKAS